MSGQNTSTENLHAIFTSDTDPNFDTSQLAFAHPLEEETSPTQFTLPVEEVKAEDKINPQTDSVESGKIKSPIKAFSSVAATALPKVDKMINGSSRHYKTLASTTSEDDERLLQG